MDNVSPLPGVHLTSASADERAARVDILARICTDDLLAAFGIDGPGLLRRALGRTFGLPARRLARQVAVYDDIVGESGLEAGGAWALERMVRRTEVEGRENVPVEGPLLMVSNHPGLADAVALFAAIPRADLRVMAADRPFLSALPNTSRYLLTLAEDPRGHLGVIREAARHLRRGGATLTFPGGKIEPDPAILPGADEALEHWSSSVDLFARLAPDLTVVPVLVSGVISAAALRNPLIFMRLRADDRRWLAATFQMLVPALRSVTTRVAFGGPIRTGELEEAPSTAVLSGMRSLMREHAG